MCDSRIRLDVGENRRLEVEADVQAGRTTAAGHQLRSVTQCAGDVRLDPVPLRRADQRTHLNLGIGGIAHLDRAGQRDEPIDDVVIQRIGKQQPAVQDAGLSGVHGTGLKQHLLQHVVGYLSVVEDDAR